MSMDEPGLSGVPGFLEELLYPGHTASFFGLFYAVAYKDMEVPLFIKRRIPADGRVPAFPDTLQRPGGCPEEMQHWLITARGKCKVTYYGSDTKLIGAEHKPCDDGYKPAESSSAGKTGVAQQTKVPFSRTKTSN
jgi:hypothetical protein